MTDDISGPVLPYARRSAVDIHKLAMFCALMLDPYTTLRILDERRQMRDALARWADDGGAFHG